MSSMGPNVAGNYADDSAVGTRTWTNPEFAISSDNSKAIISVDKNNPSHYLKLTNYGFALQPTDTITGIVVEIERINVNDGIVYMTDGIVKLVKGGAVVGTNKATLTHWPNKDTIASYGSNSDLWGTTLLYSDVNAVDFGVVLQAATDDPLTLTIGSVEGGVDNITVKVFYLAAGETSTSTSSTSTSSTSTSSTSSSISTSSTSTSFSISTSSTSSSTSRSTSTSSTSTSLSTSSTSTSVSFTTSTSSTSSSTSISTSSTSSSTSTSASTSTSSTSTSMSTSTSISTSSTSISTSSTSTSTTTSPQPDPVKPAIRQQVIRVISRQRIERPALRR